MKLNLLSFSVLKYLLTGECCSNMDTHIWCESTLCRKLGLVNIAIVFFFCINVRRGVCDSDSDRVLQKEASAGGTHQTLPSHQSGSQEHSLNRRHIEQLLHSFQSGDVHNLKYSRLGSTLQDVGVSLEKLVEISEKTYLNDLANCQEQSRKKREAGVEERSEEVDQQHGFDNDKVAFSWGNFVLGGLFAVYRPDNGKPCQKLYNVTALWLESMIYAVKKINKDPNILPGIKLGYEIRDDCSDNNKVLQAGLQFVDSMSANGSCEEFSRTIGVVGTGSSVTSATVTKLLALFEVPQVSYSASSPIFSNKQEYPYFLRTVGPDNYQAKVLVDIAKRYRWNYVAVIYSDDQYGSPGQDALSELFKQEGVCAVITHRVSEDMADDDMRMVMTRIKADEKIQAIFTFISKSDIPVVLDAAEAVEVEDRTWIATDSWGDSLATITKYKDVVTGMLWVSPRAIVDEGFKEYVQNLNPLTYADNPWYRESLDALGCHLLDTEVYSCPHSEPYQKLLDSASEGPITSLVIDAVYSLAHGLHDMLGRCTGDDCWNSSNLPDYLRYVRNVSFSGFTNDPFHFNENGDPFTQYSVFNLQNISGGEVLFEEVGFWRHDSGLNLTKPVVWSQGGAAPVSRCSEDCSPGHHIILESQVTCCWKCVPCNENEISKEVNSAGCSACNESEFVNAEKTECLKKEMLVQSWTQPSNIMILVFSLIGILGSICCFFIYVLFRDTPVVKATSTELSLICLVGIICIFITAPLFVTEPEDVVCQAQILLVGVGFSILIAALLMKTNRISRIFNRKLSDGRPSMLLQIKYQILFVISLILAQISLGLINLMVYPAIAKCNYSTEKTVFKECTVDNTNGIWFSLVVTIGYNLTLGMICNYQAFRIRKLPGQFNDSKSIFFTIFTLIIVCFALVVIALSTTGSVTMTGTAVSMLFGGYSSLSLLFGRKIWVVLFRPRHNVPQSTFDSVLKNTASTLSPVVTTTDSQLEINGNTCNGLEASKEITDEEEDDIFDSGNYSEVSTLEEDDEDLEEFLEEVAKLEKEIQSAQRERHASIRELHQVKEELRELEEMRGKDLERMKDLCRKERQSVIEILESAGYSPEEIQAKIEEVAEQKSRSNSSTDQSDQSPQEKYDAFHTEWKKRNTESENCLSGLYKMQSALFPNGFDDRKENGVHKQEITNSATTANNTTNSS